MLKNTDISELKHNVFTLIDDEWALITAGKGSEFNMMTASWAGLGVLWNKNVTFTFIRPQRFTYSLMEKYEYYTVSFYNEKYREALNICGSISGKDNDKVKMAKLTPVHDEETGAVYFAEADLVFICRKVYYSDINPENFIENEINKHYPKKDYHRQYIGEIVKCLSNYN